MEEEEKIDAGDSRRKLEEAIGSQVAFAGPFSELFARKLFWGVYFVIFLFVFFLVEKLMTC